MIKRRYWVVCINKNGFEAKFLVYGTEKETWDYLDSEIGGGGFGCTGDYSYYGATDVDVRAARILGIKAYIAPEIRED